MKRGLGGERPEQTPIAHASSRQTDHKPPARSETGIILRPLCRNSPPVDPNPPFAPLAPFALSHGKEGKRQSCPGPDGRYGAGDCITLTSALRRFWSFRGPRAPSGTGNPDGVKWVTFSTLYTLYAAYYPSVACSSLPFKPTTPSTPPQASTLVVPKAYTAAPLFQFDSARPLINVVLRRQSNLPGTPFITLITSSPVRRL